MATPENGFELIAQIFPNDYLKITYPDHVTEGYYVKYGVANGTFSLIHHSQTSKADLDLIHCSIGEATELKVLNISVLGDNYEFE